MLKKNKNILLITYFFPPAGGISCQRAIKFAQHLPHFDWNITVLTSGGNSPWKILDRTLIESVQHIDTIRITSHKLNRFFSTERHYLTKFSIALSGIKNIDVMSHWSNTICSIIPEIISRKSPDIVLITIPPFSCLKIVEEIKRFDDNIPVIVDIRDLFWILNPYGSPARKIANSMQRKKALSEIPRLINMCDGIIAPGNAIINETIHFTSLPAVTIPTPFDPKTVKGFPEYEKKEKFTILHSGRFSRSNRPGPLHYIFSLLPDDILANLQLILQGYSEKSAEKFFKPESWARLIQTVPHREALETQIQSDLNLVFVTEKPELQGNLILPGKIFDYISAGRPVIAFGPENGALLSFVKQNKLGFTAPIDFPEMAAGILSKAFRIWEKSEINQIPEETRHKFSVDVVMKKLSEFMENVMNRLTIA